VRRKFVEAEPVEPELAAQALDQIGALYEHDQRLSETKRSPEAIRVYRQEHCAPIVDAFFASLKQALDERALNTLNADLVADLQESGVAAPSTTKVGDAVAIRVNLTNHRTQDEDLDCLVDAVCDLSQARLKARR